MRNKKIIKKLNSKIRSQKYQKIAKINFATVENYYNAS